MEAHHWLSVYLKYVVELRGGSLGLRLSPQKFTLNIEQAHEQHETWKSPQH